MLGALLCVQAVGQAGERRGQRLAKWGQVGPEGVSGREHPPALRGRAVSAHICHITRAASPRAPAPAAAPVWACKRCCAASLASCCASTWSWQSATVPGGHAWPRQISQLFSCFPCSDPSVCEAFARPPAPNGHADWCTCLRPLPAALDQPPVPPTALTFACRYEQYKAREQERAAAAAAAREQQQQGEWRCRTRGSVSAGEIRLLLALQKGAKPSLQPYLLTCYHARPCLQPWRRSTPRGRARSRSRCPPPPHAPPAAAAGAHPAAPATACMLRAAHAQPGSEG